MPNDTEDERARLLTLHFAYTAGQPPRCTAEQRLTGTLNGWTLNAHLTATEDGIKVGDLVLTPPADTYLDAVASGGLRQLQLGHLYAEIERRVSRPGMVNGTGRVWLPALAKRNRRRGRAGRPLGFYAMWAQRRVEAEQVAPHAPIKWLVEEYGPQGETEATISQFIHRATDKGLLTYPSEGPRRLTAAGLAALEGAD